MSSRPWLTVLIPFHNVKPYLRQCVTSVLTQADDDVELLLLDDASDDESSLTIEDITSSGRATLFRHTTRSGVAAARNVLLDHARGEYFWFVDGDDWLAPGAISSLRAIIDNCSPDLVMCDFCIHVEAGNWRTHLNAYGQKKSFRGPARRLVTDRSQLAKGMFDIHRFEVWSKIVHRRVWGNHHRFPALSTQSDVRVSMSLALTADSFFYEPSAWVMYRRTGQSLLATTSRIEKADSRARCLGGLTERYAVNAEPLDNDVLRLWGHIAANYFVSAARMAWRHEGHQAVPRLRLYRQFFERESPIPVSEIHSHYLRSGRWWQALQLKRWLARAEGRE